MGVRVQTPARQQEEAQGGVQAKAPAWPAQSAIVAELAASA
jgi:hypothetical protein